MILQIETETKWPLSANDNLKRIFLNKNVRIIIKISLKCVQKSPINNIPALVQWPGVWSMAIHYLNPNDG